MTPFARSERVCLLGRMRSKLRSRHCPRPQHELMLTSIIGSLLREGSMPPGAIVDSGAFQGWWACYYAEQDPSRIVFAIEPDEANVIGMRERFRRVPNLRAVHAALSEQSVVNASFSDQEALGLKLYRKQRTLPGQANSTDTFSVHRVDDIFANKKVGLLHLDVEGHEYTPRAILPK